MIGLHDNIHTVSVAVVDTVGARLVWGTTGLAILVDFGLLQRLIAGGFTLLKVTSLKVEGMATVKVAINWIAYVSSVDGRSEVVVKTKAVNAFTQTVKVVVFRQAINKLDKLVLINEVGAFSSKDDISGGATLDIEPK